MNRKLRKLTLSALFCALIFVSTAFLKIPVFVHSGYAHVGDALIYTAMLFLPFPYGMAAAALGGALADIFLGYTIYAPFTLVIKAAMTLAFLSRKNKTHSLLKYLLQSMLAGIICIVCYFGTDILLFGMPGAIINFPANCLQAAASTAVFAVIASVMSNPGVKKQLGPRL